MQLVKDIARATCQNLPGHADIDDLIGAGMIGLVDAARRYDPRRGVQFRSYAQHRIRGAMMDSLRTMDQVSRTLRSQYRDVERAIFELTATLRRTPAEEEIVAALRISRERWRTVAKRLSDAGCRIGNYGPDDRPPLSVDELAGQWPDPERAAIRSELHTILENAVLSLPRRYRLVIRLYYERDQKMKEIAKVLGVNESRISQIHAAAVQRLRLHLTVSLRIYS